MSVQTRDITKPTKYETDQQDTEISNNFMVKDAKYEHFRLARSARS